MRSGIIVPIDVTVGQALPAPQFVYGVEEYAKKAFS